MTELKKFENIGHDDKADIIELQNRIEALRSGNEDEEKFKLYRLTRGVYGQRQLGVQMFRIKIPLGIISADQIATIADISDKYASSNLHLTTRQDIQLHYVKLEDSPQVWMHLTNNGLTGREACGNTVRNITASPTAGIDPNEPFDISPYALATTEYFLRNPICQEMGRKIKIAFSSSEEDTAMTYFHDFGFIPVIKNNKRGFKVLVGGGLGAVAMTAKLAYEFLHEDELIPFLEASLRVFDRYGEREKRQKARLKFLIKKIGIEQYLELVNEEKQSLAKLKVKIDLPQKIREKALPFDPIPLPQNLDLEEYEDWISTNVIKQKQEGFSAAYIKVALGDIKSNDARKLSKVLKKYSRDDVRITADQNLLLRFIHNAHLPSLYHELNQLGFASIGYGSITDVTACPGTDTCNLAVTNSTGLALAIEEFIKEEYPDLQKEKDILVKISGCMNACGQHMVSPFGFHGSSIKKDKLVIPAMQVILGGGKDDSKYGLIGEKIIKIPTKRILHGIKILIEDFKTNRAAGQKYNAYYWSKNKKYFYELLKPLASIENIEDEDFMDWGQESLYQQAIGVGECAGVILDVVGTILKDASDKLSKSQSLFSEKKYSESIYYSYTSQIIAAKALLLSHDIKCNTQIGIIKDFDTHFIETKKFDHIKSFKSQVLAMKENKPSREFAFKYLEQTENFLNNIIQRRDNDIEGSKVVIESFYKA